jgi:hypothetical protein
MRRLERFSRIFWVVAILLLAGAQLAHAYCECREAIGEATDTDAGQHDAGSTDSHSTEPHHCCHTHTHDISCLSDSTGLARLHPISGTPAVMVASFPESPVKEIDHPPQLS